MHRAARIPAGLAALLILLAALPTCVLAQATERRDAEPRPRSAEEHHAARRQWLEQQRLGDTTSAQPSYGGARGPARAQTPADAVGTAGAPYGYGPPAYAPLGYGPDVYSPYAPYSPYGVQDAWCVAQLRAARGPGPHGGLPAFAVEALCVPQPQPRGGAQRYPSWSIPGQRYDPAYPPVNRFYERFRPPQDRGVHVPAYGSGLHILPYDPWRAPPPWYYGVEPTACADVRASGLSGTVALHVGLPALGAVSPAELELAIEARIAQRQRIELAGLDGRWLVIAPGTELAELSVRPCR